MTTVRRSARVQQRRQQLDAIAAAAAAVREREEASARAAEQQRLRDAEQAQRIADDTRRAMNRARAAAYRQRRRDQQQRPTQPPWWDALTHMIAQLEDTSDYLRTYWMAPCAICGTVRLDYETAAFCCQNGAQVLEPLPPLTPFLASIASRPGVGAASLHLNQTFHFAVQGYSEGRVQFNHGPPTFAIRGTVYQRMLPADRPESPLNFYLINPMHLDEKVVEAIPSAWMRAIRTELSGHNAIFPHFQEFRDVQDGIQETTLELQSEGPTREIAGIIHYGAGARSDPRSILVHWKEHQGATRLPHLSSLYEPLAYPILFPFGTPGWPVPGWTLRQYTRYRLLTEPRFQTLTSVSNLYMVDQMCRVEDERLRFASQSLVSAHTALHGAPHEVTEVNGDDREDDPATFSGALPSSFVGSRAHRSEHVADALALAKRYGRPFGMLTLTTNPEWPEIQEALTGDQTATTVPQITVRVFRARLSKCLALFKATFGEMTYMVRVIEFQRRGLPHAHVVFKTKVECPVELLHKIVSAEIPPSTQPRLRALVRKFMRHADTHLIRADGQPNVESRCYRDGTCSFGFPQPLSDRTLQDPATGRIVYRRTTEEERMTAQYPPVILLAWEGHAHIDFSLSLESFVYIFKYIHKGPDHVDFRFRDSQLEPEETSQAVVDDFIRARYLSSTEAAWRIFGFDLTNKTPTVVRLGVHLPGQNRGQFRGRSAPGSSASSLTRYFMRPLNFADMLYSDYAEQTVSTASTEAQRNGTVALPDGSYLERVEAGQNFPPQLIKRRQRGSCVARIKSVRPGAGEVFYIRQLLLHKAATSWRDLRTLHIAGEVDVVHSTYQGAAESLGLFEGQTEAHLALQEAVDEHQPPTQLRFLFVLMVVDGAPALSLYNAFEDRLIADLLPNALQEPSDQERLLARQMGKRQLANVFRDLGADAQQYGMDSTEEWPAEVETEEEVFRPQRHAMRLAALRSRQVFNDEQRAIYDALLNAVSREDAHKLHLIQGKAGRGKTFVVHAVVNYLRGIGAIVAVTGATGLSASAFERGSTVHRMFGIPVFDNDDSMFVQSKIEVPSRRSEYLKAAQAIVIDEIWALSRSTIEAVDALLRAVTEQNEPFGGKAVIAVGDPRQTAPVLPGAGRSQVLENSLLGTALLSHFQFHELQQPIRNAGDPAFASWVDAVGEDYSCSDVDLSELFTTTTDATVAEQFLFPPYVLEDAPEAAKRAFLSPLNVDVDAFNSNILQRIPGPDRTISSFDSVKGDVETGEEPLTAPELLNELTGAKVPQHNLTLKVGALCILMRNLDPERGLVNNCKVVVQAVRSRIVVVKVLGRDDTVPLPRINFEFQPARFPFVIVRKQVPLRLAYALTFHGCQGATLDRTVVDCRRPIFAHGQRYASISRCRRRQDSLAFVLSADVEHPRPALCNNIVYRELIEASPHHATG